VNKNNAIRICGKGKKSSRAYTLENVLHILADIHVMVILTRWCYHELLRMFLLIKILYSVINEGYLLSPFINDLHLDHHRHILCVQYTLQWHYTLTYYILLWRHYRFQMPRALDISWYVRIFSRLYSLDYMISMVKIHSVALCIPSRGKIQFQWDVTEWNVPAFEIQYWTVFP
jgi:hypothetical protein